MVGRKRFDFFVFPGERHGYIGDMASYWFWLRAEYFVKHLIGEPEWSADMLALQGHFPKTSGGRKARKTMNKNAAEKATWSSTDVKTFFKTRDKDQVHGVLQDDGG